MRVQIWNHLPGGFIRLLGPAAAVRDCGGDVEIKTDIPNLVQWDHEWRSSWPGPDPPPYAYVVGLVEADTDVVVIQRPATQWIVEVIAYLRMAGIRVVVDIDDDFHSLGLTLKEATPWRSRGCVARACQLADVVTVTTSALAERYGHGRGVVLRNVVPDWYLDVRPKHPLRAIGWTGVIDAHARDLHVTGGVVGDLLDEHDDWDFAVVGEDRFIGTALGLKREVLATGMLPLDEYALAMAEITVGIVPLEANAFNAAKSALKMAQFAALGVPVVASPSPDNCRLHELGVGELADSPDEWRRKLERLVESEEARAELAHRGRAVMAGQTYERHAGRWWAAWTGEG